MIPVSENTILFLAELNSEATAMGDAALVADFDVARFRARRIQASAQAAGWQEICGAARRVLDCLGPPGAVPVAGNGEAMLRLATVSEVST